MPRGRYWRHRLCPGNSSLQHPQGPQGVRVFQPLQIWILLISLHPSRHLLCPCPPPEIIFSPPKHSIRGSLDLYSLISCPFSSLTPELPSIPSEYAGLVVRTVLEPVLQGLQGLPPEAQAPALGQALTAMLGAWLDHILTHRIRFRWGGKEAGARG